VAGASQLTRVARTAPATLSHEFIVGEDVVDPGVVTYAVTDANGTEVTSGTADGTDAAARTFDLAGQPDLAEYEVAWTGTIAGSTVVETDRVEIVGGFIFDLVKARASDASLADLAKYPTATLAEKRLEVERECEQICDRAFVPRYRRAVLDGSGTSQLLLTDAEWTAMSRSAGDIRRIRAARIAPRFGETHVDLTVGQLAACYVTGDGHLVRTDGGVWTEGVGNIVVEYEYGLDAAPEDLARAAMTMLRVRLNAANSRVPDRASSFTVDGQGTYRLSGAEAWKTGISDVDGPYARWSRRDTDGDGDAGGGQVASRTLTYQPQRHSMFHTRRY
jgi:hypothetical protein